MAVKVEGEAAKRYRIVYWGESVGDWDQAKDALEHYFEHNSLIRPQIDKTRKAKGGQHRYRFFDGREQIDLAALKRAAQG
jgi:hypothetical protein